MEPKLYNLQSGLLSQLRRLTITADYIEFENEASTKRRFIRFNRPDIVDIRHGTQTIVWGGRHTVGRLYWVSFKDRENDILEIEFRSYFNARREYKAYYLEIVDTLREKYLKPLIRHYADRFHENEEVVLGRIRLSRKGIAVTGSGLDFEWTNLQVQEKEAYFVILRRNDPKFHIWIVRNDWFAELLHGLLVAIRTG